MNSRIPPLGRLVATIAIAAWAPDARAGQYKITYPKALTWQVDANVDVAQVAGTIIWNNNSSALDQSVSPKPMTDSKSGSMNFTPPVNNSITVGSSSAMIGAAAASASDSFNTSAFTGTNKKTLYIATNAIVQGHAFPPMYLPPAGSDIVYHTNANSSALNVINVGNATFTAASTTVNGKVTPLPIQPGTLFIATMQQGDTDKPVAKGSDPITETLVDQKTGATVTQQVFTMTISATNGEVSVDPKTGALFIGATSGDALLSYDVGPGASTDQTGSAEVLDGKLILQGGLASLTWTPGTSVNGNAGFFLSANQIPDFTDNVAFNNLTVGDPYSLSISDPESIQGDASAAAVPEPSAFLLLGTGLLGLVGHHLRSRRRRVARGPTAA